MDVWDDGVIWVEEYLCCLELKYIIVCYVIYDICIYKFYFILDLLWLNDFWVEVYLVC